MSTEFDAEAVQAQAETASGDTGARTVAVDAAKVEKIITSSVYASMGIGVTLMPLVSLASVTAIQLNMVRNLSKLYGVEFKEDIAKKIIAAAAGGALPVLATGTVELLVMGIPLIGTSMAFATLPALNGLSTNAVGRMFAAHFNNGGDFVNANIDAMKASFKAAYLNSREWIGKMLKRKKTAQPESATV